MANANAMSEGQQPGEDTPEQERNSKRPDRQHLITRTEGLKLFENKETWRSEIEFAEKPSEELMAKLRPPLKSARFRWEPTAGAKGAWVKRIDFNNRAQSRMEAQRLTDELADIVGAHKTLSGEPGGHAR